MTEPRLEEKLQGLADHLDAPASTTARQAIGHRSRVLRRRRRTRNSVLGVAVVAVVAGTASVLSRGADVETGPTNPGGYRVPAITVDLDGWDVTSAEEAPTDSAEVADSVFQVFRRPGDLVGPTVFVEHTVSSDAVVPMAGQEEVQVRGQRAVLWPQGENITLSWNPSGGDSTANLHAWDLSEPEVVAFADALEERDDDVQYGPTSVDEFGFDIVASALPTGIEEERLAVAASDSPTVRSVELSDGSASVRLEAADRGGRDFEATLNSLLGYEDVESATVLERPAILYPMGADQWLAHVRLDDRSALFVNATGVDRAEFDEILDHVEEVDEKDWLDLLAAG